MFEEGLASVMVTFKRAEFRVKPNYPSSISYNVVTNVLQKGIGLSGHFTDALNMKAVSKFSTWADRFTRFLSGNDVLLFPEDVPLALDAFRAATTILYLLIVDSSSVVKILKLNTAGLNSVKPIDVINLYKDLIRLRR
jgi:beta-glucosidase-like glycosyl hydrolase